jgi:preprotein translocase subunit SecE
MPHERSKSSGNHRVETLISFLLFVAIVTAAYIALIGIIDYLARG